MKVENGTMRIVGGTTFDDIIDGYFPLRESVRQMMIRNQCKAALICFAHAPAMEIPNLSPQDPVPLYITHGHACMLHTMTLITKRVDDDVTLSGVADWSWWGGHRQEDTSFSDMHRLAEPAFVHCVKLQEPVLKNEIREQTENSASLENLTETTSVFLDLKTTMHDAKIVHGNTTIDGRTMIVEPTDKSSDTAIESTTRIIFSPGPSQRAFIKRILSDF